jgi:hypothetical protein
MNTYPRIKDEDILFRDETLDELVAVVDVIYADINEDSMNVDVNANANANANPNPNPNAMTIYDEFNINHYHYEHNALGIFDNNAGNNAADNNSIININSINNSPIPVSTRGGNIAAESFLRQPMSPYGWGISRSKDAITAPFSPIAATMTSMISMMTPTTATPKKKKKKKKIPPPSTMTAAAHAMITTTTTTDILMTRSTSFCAETSFSSSSSPAAATAATAATAAVAAAVAAVANLNPTLLNQEEANPSAKDVVNLLCQQHQASASNNMGISQNSIINYNNIINSGTGSGNDNGGSDNNGINDINDITTTTTTTSTTTNATTMPTRMTPTTTTTTTMMTSNNVVDDDDDDDDSHHPPFQTIEELEEHIAVSYFMNGMELDRNQIIDESINRSYIYTNDLTSKDQLPECLFLDVPTSYCVARTLGRYTVNKLRDELLNAINGVSGSNIVGGRGGGRSSKKIKTAGVVKNLDNSIYTVDEVLLPTNPIDKFKFKFRLRYAKYGGKLHKMLCPNFMNNNACSYGILVFIPSMKRGSPVDHFWGSIEGVDSLPEICAFVNSRKIDKWCNEIAKRHGLYRGEQPPPDLTVVNTPVNTVNAVTVKINKSRSGSGVVATTMTTTAAAAKKPPPSSTTTKRTSKVTTKKITKKKNAKPNPKKKRGRPKVVRTVAVAVAAVDVDVRIAPRPDAAVAAVAPIIVATNVAVADITATTTTLGKMISPDDKDSSKDQLNNNKKVPPIEIEMQAVAFSTSTTTMTTDAETDEFVIAEIDGLVNVMQE